MTISQFYQENRHKSIDFFDFFEKIYAAHLPNKTWSWMTSNEKNHKCGAVNDISSGILCEVRSMANMSNVWCSMWTNVNHLSLLNFWAYSNDRKINFIEWKRSQMKRIWNDDNFNWLIFHWITNNLKMSLFFIQFKIRLSQWNSIVFTKNRIIYWFK